MFAPRFATLGLDSRFTQEQGETVTYKMNDIPFTADTFDTVLDSELEDTIPDKVEFDCQKEQKSVSRTGSRSSTSNVSISIEKSLLRLLLNENKAENFNQFKTHLLDYLNNCSLNFNEYSERFDRLNLTLINLYKTMLIYKPCKGIDPAAASEFHSRYIALVMVQLFGCLSCLLSQNEINMRKFMKTFQFVMNFNAGLRKSASTKATDEFTRERIEDIVYGILRNAPKIESDIDHFAFFKQNPGLKALNHKILSYYIALAHEYVTKLNINLEEVAKRHPSTFTHRCTIM